MARKTPRKSEPSTSNDATVASLIECSKSLLRSQGGMLQMILDLRRAVARVTVQNALLVTTLTSAGVLSPQFVPVARVLGDDAAAD